MSRVGFFRKAVLAALWAVGASFAFAWLSDAADSGRLWRHVVEQASGLGLPTTFLRTMPSDFVRFEFGDLRTYAAEYHPADHRMVLNRSLSFNAAGGTLRPLARMTHKELETLYHELFHAYVDYLATEYAEAATMPPLLTFAKAVQQCRYQAVLITPLVQRKLETEERYLTEQESWEALNETWAVFVGWAVWTQLEVGKGKNGHAKGGRGQEAWLARLRQADSNGDLRGYYEPADPAEREITRKRFLAPAYRLSAAETEKLMEILEFPPELVRRSLDLLRSPQSPPREQDQCG